MLGIYVTYKEQPYIVVEATDKQFKLNSPTLNRVKVSIENTKPMKCDPAKQITYKGNKYLVTVKGVIFSLVSGKEMKWDDNNGNRKAILALADNPF